MGCHPVERPGSRQVSAGGTDIVPSLDFPRPSRRKAALHREYGYGLGDSDLVALQEDLLRIYAEELSERRSRQGDRRGQALHHQPAALTVYDEKVLDQMDEMVCRSARCP